jgi:hypothetical protein
MTKTEVTSENLFDYVIQAERFLLSLFYWVKNWLKFVIKLSFSNYKPAVVLLVGE